MRRFPSPPPRPEAPPESTAVLTVADLNRHARQVLEGHFPLLWVAGEISNLTRAPSGHIYFTLKDESAQVRCVMFRQRAQLLPWQLGNGQHVEARALVSLYEARGDFQLGVESLRRAGIGRLHEALQRLRQRLEGEGLFASERKKALPTLPRRIGIVTSLQAAALRDILTVLRRRAPAAEIVILPSAVQGAEAPPQLVAALAAAARLPALDVLIIARGGGSLEDLWAFNDEAVVRAIAACRLPTISGVGHETDTTLSDLAADQRAATPSVAAELVSAGWHSAKARLLDLGRRLAEAATEAHGRPQQKLDELGLRLAHPAQQWQTHAHRLALAGRRLHAALLTQLHQRRRLSAALHLRLLQQRPQAQSLRQHLEILGQRLRQAGNNRLESSQHHLAAHRQALELLAPETVLRRGYALVRDQRGELLRANAVTPGAIVEVQLAAARFTARVEKVQPDPTS